MTQNSEVKVLPTFYQFMMTYRGRQEPNNQSLLADWMFFDHDFPKHSDNYSVLSDYLEFNSPFTDALIIFDELWDTYLMMQY